MYCPNCGAQARENASFCEVCGEQLPGAGNPQPPVEPVTRQNTNDDYSRPQPAYASQDPEHTQRASDASAAYTLGIISLILLFLPGFVVIQLVLSAVGMYKAANALGSVDAFPKARSGQVMCRITFWLTVAFIILCALATVLTVVFAVNVLEYFGVDKWIEELADSVRRLSVFVIR